MSQYELGLEGELIAEQYLKDQGYRILEKRMRGRHGEVDLLAEKHRVLYFVEVKYRPKGRLGTGMASISKRKKDMLQSVIRAYLNGKPRAWRLAYLEITRSGILFHDDVLHEN